MHKQAEKNAKIIIGGVIVVLLITFFMAFYVAFLIKTNNIAPADLAKNEITPEPVVSERPIVKGLIDVEMPSQVEISTDNFEYEIKGTNSSAITDIELKITNVKNEQGSFPVRNFHKGDTSWSYKLNDNNTTLAEGRNTIQVIAYQDYVEVGRVVRIIEATIPKINLPVMLKVNWDKELGEEKDNCNNNFGECYTYYKAGTVAEGEYKGAALYLKSFQEGPGGPSFSHSIVLNNGREVNLEENKIGIEGLYDLPDSITVPGKNYELIKGLVAYNLFPDSQNAEVLFRDAKLGDFYDMNGCAVAELPEHTAVSYDFDIPFNPAEITFLNGEKNTGSYRYRPEQRGCGPICVTLEYADVMSEERLKLAGAAANGAYVYEFNDPNDEDLKSFYSNYEGSFSSEYEKPPTEKKISYTEFLKSHPYLFWKDPFGRWVKFTNERFIPIQMVEMCKPAIYLYPEKETRLNVEVAPNGGFTYTNPPYGNGWNVNAYPNGQITDLATGKNYDYLYWEGMGLNYPLKDEGWVVKKEDLSGFFDQKLRILGLNTKETSEFKEYWLERLSAMPYYQISFLTSDELNLLAPIKILPEKPQTLIRVMMVAKGSDKVKQISPQYLPPTPDRNGFTAVEWGGSLLR